jgi:hypothetical protein
MRFIILVKANEQSELGSPPDSKMLSEMGKFNEELIKAGVMLDGNGLMASKNGKRVHFSGSKRSVIDGPFAEAKELVAGYWVWQCKSMAEAVEWVKRCPNPQLGDSDIEIRQIWEMSDLPDVPDHVRGLEAKLAASKKL